MKNKEVELIAKLRDDATVTWNKIRGTVESGAKGLVSTFTNIRGIIAAVFTGAVFKGLIDSARDAELSASRLDAALTSAGDSSLESRNKFEQWATSIQKTTLLTDEQARDTLALVLAMRGQVEGSQRVAEAAIDLSAALGISSEQAVRMIVATINGKNMLARYGIEVEKNITGTDRFSAVLGALAIHHGAAARQADTLSGRMQQVAKDAEELQETIGFTALQIASTFSPTIRTVIELLGKGLIIAIGSLQIAFTRFFQIILAPFMLIEKALNAIGISSSTVVQRTVEAGDVLVKKFEIDIKNALDGVSISTSVFGKSGKTAMREIDDGVTIVSGSIKELEERLKTLKTEFEATPQFTAKWIDLATQITATERAIADMRRISEQVGRGKEIKDYRRSWDEIRSTIRAIPEEEIPKIPPMLSNVEQANLAVTLSFQDAWSSGLNAVTGEIIEKFSNTWNTMFGEANSLLEIFVKAFMEALVAIAAKAAALAIFNLIFSGSGSILNLFHGGGRVPIPAAHSGMFIDAPPARQFPIMVRGGETIRTEVQEAQIQSRSSQIVFNINGPIADAAAFKKIIERGMRQLGVTDVRAYFVNQHSKLTLGMS